MALIPNFPQDLLDQHHHWHEPDQHRGAGPGRLHPMGSTGGGTEFLVFHRDFSAQVLAWYFTTNFTAAPFNDAAQKAALVTAWRAVPIEMTKLPDWVNWKDDASRLGSGVPNFNSDDELGTYIETRIHNSFLHGAAAAVFNELEVKTLHSPHSTLFYKIHGLVGHWWSTWQRRNFLDPHRPVPSLGHQGPGSTVLFPDRPVPSLSASGAQSMADPGLLKSLGERVALLEARTFPMRATLETPAGYSKEGEEGDGGEGYRAGKRFSPQHAVPVA